VKCPPVYLLVVQEDYARRYLADKRIKERNLLRREITENEQVSKVPLSKHLNHQARALPKQLKKVDYGKIQKRALRQPADD
jgi:hypothetical protein